MYKLMVVLKHKPEEYNVTVNKYDSEGKLVETTSYNGVKQVVFRTREVYIARQLSLNPLVVITHAEKPKTGLRGSGVLYIVDEALGFE
ncbi:MAG: hypothetical protein ABWW65_07515 [Thermoprotei archaeon]